MDKMQLKVVSYQYRWANPSNCTDVEPSEVAWKAIEVPPGSTEQAVIDELLSRKWKDGHTYEVRQLYAVKKV